MIKKKIKKNIFAYIIWIPIAIFIIGFEFAFVTRIKDDEKINFFISSTALNNQEFNDFIQSNKPSYLRSLSYRNVDYHDERNFLSQFSSVGAADSDIFLLPLEALEKVKPQYYFFSLDQSKTNETYNSTLEYYIGENGYTYGFKINSHFFNNENVDYYLMFAKTSLHMGILNDTELDGNITLSKLFLE